RLRRLTPTSGRGALDRRVPGASTLESTPAPRLVAEEDRACSTRFIKPHGLIPARRTLSSPAARVSLARARSREIACQASGLTRTNRCFTAQIPGVPAPPGGRHDGRQRSYLHA